MEKPTAEEIIEYAKTRNFRKPIEVTNFPSGICLIYTYKTDARCATKSINDKYGEWLYASMCDLFRNPHVSIGFRSIRLEKCAYCGWLDGAHSMYCHRPN